MGRLRIAASATIASQGLGIAAALLSFVIAPFYIKFLGLERMGLLAVAQAIAGYLALANGGINASTMILVSHAHGRDDWPSIAKVFRHGLLLSLAAVVVVVLLSAALGFGLSHPTIAAAVGLTHAESLPLIMLTGAQVVVALLFGNFYNLLTGLQDTQRAVLLQGGARIVGLVLGVLAAAFFHTAYSIVAVQTASNAVAGCLGAAYAFARYRQSFAPAAIEREHVSIHVRTGAKSFGLQVGAAIGSSAPVLAINHAGGSASVPSFTLPLQLINICNSLIVSFASLMQPAFGEAWSRGDREWIRHTVVGFIDKIVLLLLVASAGFLAVGGPLVKAWVGLDISTTMLLSVVIVSSSQTMTAWWKGLLSGINHHRLAAQSELLNGFLTLLFAWLVCRKNTDAVGLGVLLAGAVTSYWVLPGEIRRHLEVPAIFPRGRKLLAMGAVASAVYLSAFGVLATSPGGSRTRIFVQVGLATLTGLIVFILSASALRLIDVRTIVARGRR